jgi:hypothetical protein
MAAVAPGVRFNALAIFLTPALAFAIDFNVRRSSFVHERRTTVFFLAIVTPMWERPLSTSIQFINAPRFAGADKKHEGSIFAVSTIGLNYVCRVAATNFTKEFD